MNKKVCRIVCAGKNYDYNFNFDENDYIIAVDGGYKYLEKYSIKPDIVVGDFDSLGYVPDGKNIIKLNPQKDETDTYYAVDQALKNGAEEIYIYCGTGGEIDHTLANIQTIIHIAKNGKRGYLLNDKKVVTAIKEGQFIEFSKNANGYISILSASEKCEGVNIEGLLYKAKNIEIYNNFPIGARNEFNNKDSRISVEKGCLIVIFNYEEIKNTRSKL